MSYTGVHNVVQRAHYVVYRSSFCRVHEHAHYVLYRSSFCRIQEPIICMSYTGAYHATVKIFTQSRVASLQTQEVVSMSSSSPSPLAGLCICVGKETITYIRCS